MSSPSPSPTPSSDSYRTRSPKNPRRRDDAGFRIKEQQAYTNESTFDDDLALGAKYVIDGHLRRLPPYYFTYLTFCKQRWRDRNLLEVFVSEFRDRDAEYYKQAIMEGQVQINGKPTNLETIIRNGDSICHRTHKHEPAVTSREIRIVHEDDELVVINKPSGIPVHPTGRFRLNTVVMILKYENNLLVHRK
jgi:tRNA pseudouridine synthase 8/2,5-diamino-6-(5-phospho-D-ribitylamino)-pyrimidin-4(3H)-one deaminase